MNQSPNILWVSFEDCYPYFGCYGDPIANTPNLDKLAAEGTLWSHAFSTAPVCGPARSAVITGMYPISIGTHHHRTGTGQSYANFPHNYEAVIPHYVKCIPEYLRAAGYHCTNNAKTDYQFNSPITAWDDCSTSGHWRNRPDPEQPFFAVWNLTKTHESQMWEDKWSEREFDLDAIDVPPYFPDTAKVRESMARMYANIEFNDQRLGEILDELAEDDLDNNTVVFIWTDHGPMPRGKRWPYDSGIRSPMIVRWPGHLTPGTVSNQLVSTVDLGPTILSICGVEIPHHIQGEAFLGSQKAEPRKYIFAARDRYDEMYDTTRAGRDQRFKYLRHYHPEEPKLRYNRYRNIHPIMQEMWRLHAAGELTGPQLQMFTKRPVEELYDTVTDPHEINNLAGDPAYADELVRLRNAVTTWQNEVGDLGLVPEDVMVGQMLPTGKQPTTHAPMFIVLGGGKHIDQANNGVESNDYQENWGIEESDDGGKFEGPILLQMQSSTQGASIAYTLDEGDEPHWQLHHEPLQLTSADDAIKHFTVRAKAIRIGYRESEEVKATFTVM
ncbi:MAG: sulfatase-like hydrolase/transferase [Chloroflexota bacterium]